MVVNLESQRWGSVSVALAEGNPVLKLLISHWWLTGSGHSRKWLPFTILLDSGWRIPTYIQQHKKEFNICCQGQVLGNFEAVDGQPSSDDSAARRKVRTDVPLEPGDGVDT